MEKDTSVSNAPTYVDLDHEVRTKAGGIKTVTVRFGNIKRKKPIDRETLELAQEIVLNETTEIRIAEMGKRVFKAEVWSRYNELQKSARGNKKAKQYRNTKNVKRDIHDKYDEENKPNYSNPIVPPGEMTIVDVDKPSGTTALVLGSSFSGKTSFLMHAVNIIKKGKYYDVIIVFTESINAEPLKDLPKNALLANAFYPSVVKLAYQINRATKNRYRFLFILDDIVKYRSKDIFQKMILTYRNSGISTIVLTHYSKLLAPAQRTSVHKIYFMGNRAQDERDYLVKNWLKGHVQNRGITQKDDIDEWFIANTRMGAEDERTREKDNDKGRFIMLDNVRDIMTVQERPT